MKTINFPLFHLQYFSRKTRKKLVCIIKKNLDTSTNYRHLNGTKPIKKKKPFFSNRKKCTILSTNSQSN